MGTKEILVTEFRRDTFPGYNEIYDKNCPVPPLQQKQRFISSEKIPNMHLFIFEQ